MTRYGVLLKVQAWPERTPEAMMEVKRQWEDVAFASPRWFPVWHRLDGSPVGRIEEMVDRLPSETVLYLSTADVPQAILAHEYDDEIDAIGSVITPDTIVRINQEPNGFPQSPWAEWGPELWGEVCGYIMDRMNNGRGYACMIDRGGASPEDWFPYLDAWHDADFIGFDIYARSLKKGNGQVIPFAKRIQRKVDRLVDKYQKRVILGEVGVVRGPGHTKVVQQLGQVGCHSIMVADSRMMADHPDHDWRLHRDARAAVADMMR